MTHIINFKAMRVNITYLRLLIPLILANIFQRTISHSYNKLVCNFDDYYELYLTVQESRSDLPIKEIRVSGYVDLTTDSGIICLNGPAFLHTKVNTTNPPKKVFMVDPAEIQVFEHECKSFNMRNSDQYLLPSLPELREDTVVSGEKIFGVTLFGDSDDYRKPSKEMYYNSKFGYLHPPDPSVTEASFAFMVVPTGKLQSGPIPPCVPPTGSTSCTPCVPTVADPCSPYRTLTDNPKAYCLSIEKLRINITFVPKPTAIETDNTGYVCTVKEPFSDPEIAKLFTNLTRPDYKWYDCPDGDYGSLTPSTTLNISQLIDFRIIDPHLLTSLGSPGKPPKPGYPGYPVSPTSSFLPPTYGLFPYPGYYFPNDPNYPHGLDPNATNFTNIRYDATECSPEIPKPQDSCDGGNENTCQYLHHVMGSAKTDWHLEVKSDGTVDSDTGAPPYADRQAGVWRLEIMHLVDEIFGKACPQVSPMLAPAVSRIIEFYLLESLKTPAAMDIWKDTADKKPKQKWEDTKVLESLKACKEAINDRNRLDFRRVRNLEILDQINEINEDLSKPDINPRKATVLQQKFQQKRYQFPFDVKIIKGTQPYNIYDTKEAAEIDYDLNLAIDLHWKIVNTVNGFCTRIFPAITPAFVPNFYTDYHDDIFSFIKSTWINADDSDTSNEVFKQLFGAFINGGASIYLDSCMEGAYIGTPATPKWRELRDVELREERSDPSGGSPIKTNFAIKMPPNRGVPVQYASANTG